MSKSVAQFIREKIERQENEGLRRTLKVVSGLVDFSSNDYLGLARNEDLFNRITTESFAISRSNGSTGSRLLTGNSRYIEETEHYLAEFFQGEAALIFNSGYSANIGILSALPQKDDTILYDELSHASIKDGARLSIAKRFSFRHNDIDDLEQKIRRASGRVFIVAESIYSMDGDECDLPSLCTLAEKYDACLILDEAHSTGTRGDSGRGKAVDENQHSRIFARIYTFGKAIGVHGACIVGSKMLREYLINFSRPFVYTTALSPHSIASVKVAFRFLMEYPGLQQELDENISRFKTGMQNIQHCCSNSSIQTLIFPGNDNTKAASNYLARNGYDVRPILSPTVPKGAERLRICLHTYNTEVQIAGLCKLLGEMKDIEVS